MKVKLNLMQQSINDGLLHHDITHQGFVIYMSKGQHVKRPLYDRNGRKFYMVTDAKVNEQHDLEAVDVELRPLEKLANYYVE